MQEIIAIQEKVFLDAAVPTVNARDLHAFLGNKDNFATWIKDRINQYDFIENQDFISFLETTKKPQGGRPSKEYHLTLDMAKELSMVERTAKGKEARQYFIACEKAYRQGASANAPMPAQPKYARFADVDWPAVARMHAAYKRVAKSRKIPVTAQVTVADLAVESLIGVPLRAIIGDAIAQLGDIDGPVTDQHAKARPLDQVNQVDIDSIQETDIRLSPDATLNVSDLGALLGGYTGIAFNRLLYGLGYQVRHTIRGKSEWHPTEKGTPFAVKTFVPRTGGRGADVPQLLWKAKVLDALRTEPAVQKNFDPAKH
jgi:phage anti-repressor protein